MRTVQLKATTISIVLQMNSLNFENFIFLGQTEDNILKSNIRIIIMKSKQN